MAFKKLTEAEKLRNAEAENKKLLQKNADLEDALLELAEIISAEVHHG